MGELESREEGERQVHDVLEMERSQRGKMEEILDHGERCVGFVPVEHELTIEFRSPPEFL